VLSYFWEAANRDEFPIMYPSSREALEALGFVVDWPSPADSYRLFHELFVAIRETLGSTTWDTEAFLHWISELPFPGVDPDSFAHLARNATLNQQFVSGEGYPAAEVTLEAKRNITGVLKHLRRLQAALKPEVSHLFAGETRTSLAGAQSSWNTPSRFRDEAWAVFNSRAESYYQPSLQIGLTPQHAYWAFHFGSDTKDLQAAWSRAPEAFAAARAAGARVYVFPLEGEPQELASLDVPLDLQHRGVFVGWLVGKDNPTIRSPLLVEHIASDLRAFGPAVRSLIETTPLQPEDLAPQATIELIGAVRSAEHVQHDAARLAERGRIADWWSFKIRPEFRDALAGKTFYLNVYRQKAIIARYRVIDWRMTETNEGIPCPWPDAVADELQGLTAAGQQGSEQFRTWFLVDRIDPLDSQIGLDAFEWADSHATPTPSQLVSSFAYVVPAAADPWEELARRLYVEPAFLLEIQQLLRERKQLIFYGPPGTGKTYVAKRFAEAFIGGRGDVELVQFHPSYSYEEFVEGLHPAAVEGQISYSVVPGRLLEFARRAQEDEDGTYILIVDEINRANLSKVFGELFFLLEYRDETIPLAYSGRGFALPGNLFIIGTMNTADRSIALVDFALRRRFGFVPFYPDSAMRQLRTYLQEHGKQEYEYVADMLSEVNQAIQDPDFRLGHSYFMFQDPELLDAERIERTWRYSVEPYLREYWYDDDAQQTETFSFNEVRARVTPAGGADTSAHQPDIADDPGEPLTGGPA
jgi:5-methylcytosine-specific restriction enzyme B